MNSSITFLVTLSALLTALQLLQFLTPCLLVLGVKLIGWKKKPVLVTDDPMAQLAADIN